MLNFKNFITEGLEDPASFKAIMMAGGAGAGKIVVHSIKLNAFILIIYVRVTNFLSSR